jgi:hypothetical protein
MRNILLVMLARSYPNAAMRTLGQMKATRSSAKSPSSYQFPARFRSASSNGARSYLPKTHWTARTLSKLRTRRFGIRSNSATPCMWRAFRIESNEYSRQHFLSLLSLFESIV